VASTGGCSSLSDFKQLSLLGEGAYSAVYKVMRLADNEVYALKKVKMPSLSDKEKQNALNEVRLLASVQHENVIAYKEAFFDDKTRCLCIVQECADAGDLLQQVNRCKQERAYLRENDVWRYLEGMCLGLKALHDLRVLHRDMKCANVFLSHSTSPDGTIAKLGDFNVSKVAKRGLCMTQTGTPYYASPEVWRDMPYDAKSDMWSLGCVLYEMVALRPPFRAEDMEGLYRKVVRGQYPRIPAHYGPDLAEVIAALLQVHPRHRPTVEQLLQMPQMARHLSAAAPAANSPGSDLLGTIKLPKNSLDLSVALPKPRYTQSHTDLREEASGGSPSAGSPVGAEARGASEGPPASRRPGDPGVPPPFRSPAAPSSSASRGRLPSNPQPPPELRRPQDGSDAHHTPAQTRPQHATSSTPGTPQRGQGQDVPDSLDAYLQRRQGSLDQPSQAAGTVSPQQHYSRPPQEDEKADGRAVQYQGTAAQANAPCATPGYARDGRQYGAGPTINPRYNPQSRPPREPRRPMSIYARQQYVVADQVQQQVEAQKESTPVRRRRLFMPRLF